MDNKKLRHYLVRGVLPGNAKGNPYTWRHNVKYGVIASTPEVAGMQVRMTYPDITILSITHRGQIDLFHEAEEILT